MCTAPCGGGGGGEKPGPVGVASKWAWLQAQYTPLPFELASGGANLPGLKVNLTTGANSGTVLKTEVRGVQGCQQGPSGGRPERLLRKIKLSGAAQLPPDVPGTGYAAVIRPGRTFSGLK